MRHFHEIFIIGGSHLFVSKKVFKTYCESFIYKKNILLAKRKQNDDKMRVCPYCGREMIHHVFNDKVYWVCKHCKREIVTPKNIDLMAGTL